MTIGLLAAGWTCRAVAGRDASAPSVNDAARIFDAPAVDLSDAGRNCDVVVLATPDGEVARVAVKVAQEAAPSALLVHLAGSFGLDVFDEARALRPDLRVAALHPLMAIPTPELGVRRLAGGRCGVAGDAEVLEIASALGAEPFVVTDEERIRYHAAAVVASNHVVALLGHLERLAASANLSSDAFLPLVRDAVDAVEDLGAAAALTGPVARGDASTIAAHLAALPPAEVFAYRALAREALRLTDHADDLVPA